MASGVRTSATATAPPESKMHSHRRRFFNGSTKNRTGLPYGTVGTVWKTIGTESNRVAEMYRSRSQANFSGARLDSE